MKHAQGIDQMQPPDLTSLGCTQRVCFEEHTEMPLATLIAINHVYRNLS